MPVIVTRPAQEAGQWVARLQARGIDAVAWPLIEIVPVPDQVPLARAWFDLPQLSAAMFVSANAVRGFFAACPALPATWPRAWATGPGTRDALLAAGWPPEKVDAPADDAGQFDSEALWPLVQTQVRPGALVLIVRGGDAAGQPVGRDWLSGRLVAAGGQARFVVAYGRRAPVWTAEQAQAARAAASDANALWLFSSSEAVANLGALLPGQGWQAARALATHPRIAQAARALGFGGVDGCRPAFEDVVASIESRR